MKLASYALVLVPLTAFALLGASCSAGDESPGYDTPDAAPGVDATPITHPKDSGSDSSKGKDSASSGGDDANVSPDGSEDDASAVTDGSTTTDTSTPTDGDQGTDAGWVNMTSADGAPNTHGCDDLPGVACGWSATNNGLGYTCRCANPTWADPWGCEAPDSGAPELCPPPDAGGDSSTGVDSGSEDAGDSGKGGEDSGSGDAGDAGTITDAQSNVDAAWVDMTSADGAANPHACDNDPGAPCGWSPTNNGLGYTCRCVNPTWADPWGCEPPDSGIPAACP